MLIVCTSEERDEYDDAFDKMKAASTKSRLVKAAEEKAALQETIEDLKVKVIAAQKQVSLLHLINYYYYFIIIQFYISPKKHANTSRRITIVGIQNINLKN